MWELSVAGVAGHSGLTHNCVNALELAMATVLSLVRWFEEKYAPHPDEARWGFLGPSTLKPTVISVPNNKITKIPGSAVVEGDIRLTPFYDMREAIDGAVAFVAALDQRIEAGDPPVGFPRVRTVSGQRGSVRLSPKGRFMEGIACQLDSPGLVALTEAIRAVRGSDGSQPFAMTGSLPLVRDLQRRGFDVQITGFGRSVFYHAPNEQAKLEHFEQGFRILRELIARL
jgi:acetylornithine deacetylase/succinyl-diaminopimelate desuccinylase-like protein